MLHDPENTTLVTPCSIEQALLAGLWEEMNVALLNILYLSLNIWTCKTSGKTFLGIAIIWVTRTFTLCTALLAVSNALFKRSFSYDSFYCVSFTTAGNLGGTEPSVWHTTVVPWNKRLSAGLIFYKDLFVLSVAIKIHTALPDFPHLSDFPLHTMTFCCITIFPLDHLLIRTLTSWNDISVCVPAVEHTQV